MQATRERFDWAAAGCTCAAAAEVWSKSAEAEERRGPCGGRRLAGGAATPAKKSHTRTQRQSATGRQRRSGVGKAMPRSRHEAGDWSAKRAGLSRPDAVSVCNARTQRDGALPTYSISRRSGMVGFLGSSQTQSNDQRGPGQRRQQKK